MCSLLGCSSSSIKHPVKLQYHWVCWFWCPSLTHVIMETDRNMQTIYPIHTAQILWWALAHLPWTAVCKARIICPSHFIDKQTKETQGTLRNAQDHTAATVRVKPTLLLKFDLLMTALGLHCCTQAFSNCSEGPVCRCNEQPSHFSAFSCWK